MLAGLILGSDLSVAATAVRFAMAALSGPVASERPLSVHGMITGLVRRSDTRYHGG